jgi:hypothetical protein
LSAEALYRLGHNCSLDLTNYPTMHLLENARHPLKI